MPRTKASARKPPAPKRGSNKRKRNNENDKDEQKSPKRTKTSATSGKTIRSCMKIPQLQERMKNTFRPWKLSLELFNVIKAHVNGTPERSTLNEIRDFQRRNQIEVKDSRKQLLEFICELARVRKKTKIVHLKDQNIGTLLKTAANLMKEVSGENYFKKTKHDQVRKRYLDLKITFMKISSEMSNPNFMTDFDEYNTQMIASWKRVQEGEGNVVFPEKPEAAKVEHRWGELNPGANENDMIFMLVFQPEGWEMLPFLAGEIGETGKRKFTTFTDNFGELTEVEVDEKQQWSVRTFQSVCVNTAKMTQQEMATELEQAVDGLKNVNARAALGVLLKNRLQVPMSDSVVQITEEPEIVEESTIAKKSAAEPGEIVESLEKKTIQIRLGKQLSVEVALEELAKNGRITMFDLAAVLREAGGEISKTFWDGYGRDDVLWVVEIIANGSRGWQQHVLSKLDLRLDLMTAPIEAIHLKLAWASKKVKKKKKAKSSGKTEQDFAVLAKSEDVHQEKQGKKEAPEEAIKSESTNIFAPFNGPGLFGRCKKLDDHVRITSTIVQRLQLKNPKIDPTNIFLANEAHKLRKIGNKHTGKVQALKLKGVTMDHVKHCYELKKSQTVSKADWMATLVNLVKITS